VDEGQAAVASNTTDTVNSNNGVTVSITMTLSGSGLSAFESILCTASMLSEGGQIYDVFLDLVNSTGYGHLMSDLTLACVRRRLSLQDGRHLQESSISIAMSAFMENSDDADDFATYWDEAAESVADQVASDLATDFSVTADVSFSEVTVTVGDTTLTVDEGQAAVASNTTDTVNSNNGVTVSITMTLSGSGLSAFESILCDTMISEGGDIYGMFFDVLNSTGYGHLVSDWSVACVRRRLSLQDGRHLQESSVALAMSVFFEDSDDAHNFAPYLDAAAESIAPEVVSIFATYGITADVSFSDATVTVGDTTLTVDEGQAAVASNTTDTVNSNNGVTASITMTLSGSGLSAFESSICGVWISEGGDIYDMFFDLVNSTGYGHLVSDWSVACVRRRLSLQDGRHLQESSVALAMSVFFEDSDDAHNFAPYLDEAAETIAPEVTSMFATFGIAAEVSFSNATVTVGDTTLTVDEDQAAVASNTTDTVNSNSGATVSITMTLSGSGLSAVESFICTDAMLSEGGQVYDVFLDLVNSTGYGHLMSDLTLACVRRRLSLQDGRHLQESSISIAMSAFMENSDDADDFATYWDEAAESVATQVASDLATNFGITADVSFTEVIVTVGDTSLTVDEGEAADTTATSATGDEEVTTTENQGDTSNVATRLFGLWVVLVTFVLLR